MPHRRWLIVLVPLITAFAFADGPGDRQVTDPHSINSPANADAHWVPSRLVEPLGTIMTGSGCLCEVIWLTYFFIPQPERRISDVAPESRRWEYALASIQSPAPEGMFLTSIDRTVEKLLVKNNVATQSKPKEERHWFGD